MLAKKELEKIPKLEEIPKKELSPKDKISFLGKVMGSVKEAAKANEKSEIGEGCEYEHTFTNGIYVRKMFIPKGLLIVTKVHKTQHPYFILQGDVSVYLEGIVVRLQAPYSGITEPGTQRALFTHEDTIWITVHSNLDNCKDVEKISKDVVLDSMEDYEKEIKLLGGSK